MTLVACRSSSFRGKFSTINWMKWQLRQQCDLLRRTFCVKKSGLSYEWKMEILISVASSQLLVSHLYCKKTLAVKTLFLKAVIPTILTKYDPLLKQCLLVTSHHTLVDNQLVIFHPPSFQTVSFEVFLRPDEMKVSNISQEKAKHGETI